MRPGEAFRVRRDVMCDSSKPMMTWGFLASVMACVIMSSPPVMTAKRPSDGIKAQSRCVNEREQRRGEQA
jgi:hypothetical protein